MAIIDNRLCVGGGMCFSSVSIWSLLLLLFWFGNLNKLILLLWHSSNEWMKKTNYSEKTLENETKANGFCSSQINTSCR